jgi:hypothetical protein
MNRETKRKYDLMEIDPLSIDLEAGRKLKLNDEIFISNRGYKQGVKDIINRLKKELEKK